MTQEKTQKITALFDQPLLNLIHQAQTIHQENFDPRDMELCTLLNIKTGACPEDCSYCSQSGHFKTGLRKEKLMDLDKVLVLAQKAKNSGAQRFCMGAAWRNPSDKDLPKVIEMIQGVKNLGLETCVTLGMLTESQAHELKQAGLDFYNHNLDTSPEFYSKIISTRTYQDRLETLAHIQKAGINTCCGGILGMGETREDRISFLKALYELPKPPTSIPINKLIPIPGTPLGNTNPDPIDNFELVRLIAATRILFPKSMIRLSAGRESMSDELQALCFLSGANSIFYGEALLTTKNPSESKDQILLRKLGLRTPEISCPKISCPENPC